MFAIILTMVSTARVFLFICLTGPSYPISLKVINKNKSEK